MAYTLRSSPPPLPFFTTSSSSSSFHRLRFTCPTVGRSSKRAAGFFVKNASEDKESDGSRDSPSFNPFGFVTDNPSSRAAIQLSEVPAEDGNVGQIGQRTWAGNLAHSSNLTTIPGLSGKQVNHPAAERPLFDHIFPRFLNYALSGSPESRREIIVFLHGAPTQSYSYRNVMSQLSEAVGFHCLAPDWLGFGFSDKPQEGYEDFRYTENEYHVEFDNLLEKLGVKSPFILAVQGFMVGSYGLTWALKNQSRISKLVVLNTPLTVSSPVPGLFQQLRIPLFSEFTCQNAITAERFIEAGSAYKLKLEKADVYRLPYLSSSGPGFALLEVARKANFNDIASKIAAGFSSGRWEKPILVVWGVSDKYLPQSIAEEFQKRNPDKIQLKLIEGAGHMPQEDWPEKVVDALRYFLL